jgi:hypothetical protein
MSSAAKTILLVSLIIISNAVSWWSGRLIAREAALDASVAQYNSQTGKFEYKELDLIVAEFLINQRMAAPLPEKAPEKPNSKLGSKSNTF